MNTMNTVNTAAMAEAAWGADFFALFFETALEKREQTGYIIGVNTKVTR